jgi:hypothetical protein
MNEPFTYIKGYERYKYGQCNRLPADQLLVKQINKIMDEYPDFRMALPGTSGVHGETFPLFRTQCMFTLADIDAVVTCLAALKERDEFNRTRKEVLWNWEMVATKGTTVLFFVNWLDFAYFLKSREAFLGSEHSEYTKSFGLSVKDIKYKHMRVLEDGTEVEFDENTLTEEEQMVVKHLDKIQFDRSFQHRA